MVASGVPGLKTERAWVGEDLRVMRDPPVDFTGLGRLRGEDAMAAEVLRGRPRRHAAFRRPGQAPSYGN